MFCVTNVLPSYVFLSSQVQFDDEMSVFEHAIVPDHFMLAKVEYIL